MAIALLYYFLYCVMFLMAGFLVSIPYLPCLLLSLERMSSGYRLCLLAGAIGVFAIPFGVINPSLGMVTAIHLLAATCALMVLKCFLNEWPQFSLRALLLFISMLAVALAVTTPLMSNRVLFSAMEFWLSLVIVAPTPALLAWASVSLKRRLVVVLLFFLGTGALLQWSSGSGRIHWPIAWALLMMQIGFSLSIVPFTRCFLRDELVSWPRPIDQADTSPGTFR